MNGVQVAYAWLGPLRLPPKYSALGWFATIDRQGTLVYAHVVVVHCWMPRERRCCRPGTEPCTSGTKCVRHRALATAHDTRRTETNHIACYCIDNVSHRFIILI